MRRLVALIVTWFGLAAAPAAEPGVLRVLPPSVGPRLEAALRALEPAWRAANIGVQPDHVRLELCPPADGPCVELRLDAPRDDCPGVAAPDWCVTGPASAPASLVEKVATLVGPPASAVQTTQAAVPWKAVPTGPSTAVPRLAAYAGALAELLLPLLSGWLLAAVLRRVRPGLLAPLPRVAVALAPAAVLLLIGPPRLDVGAWDLALIGGLAGLGFALGVRSGAAPRPAHRARRLVAVVATLALVEGGARLLPAASTGFPPPEAAAWWLSSLPRGQGCRLLDPGFGALVDERLARVDSTLPVVLHVGDSMVEGTGVAPDLAFPSVLGRLDPAHAHVNAGLWGTGPDVYRVAVQRWLERLHPAAVVVHVFLGNDLGDLDAPQPCCADAPILRYRADGAEPACSAERTSEGVGTWLRSPPPYALRVATEGSAAARLACLAFGASAGPGARDDELRWRHLGLVLADLSRLAGQAGVPLFVAVLPERLELEAVDGYEVLAPERRARFLALVGLAGLPVLDPTADIAREARSGSVQALFVHGSGRDVHFSAAGHALYAAWLAARIPGLTPTR